jgi:hypothetical protein
MGCTSLSVAASGAAFFFYERPIPERVSAAPDAEGAYPIPFEALQDGNILNQAFSIADPETGEIVIVRFIECSTVIDGKTVREVRALVNGNEIRHSTPISWFIMRGGNNGASPVIEKVQKRGKTIVLTVRGMNCSIPDHAVCTIAKGLREQKERSIIVNTQYSLTEGDESPKELHRGVHAVRFEVMARAPEQQQLAMANN